MSPGVLPKHFTRHSLRALICEVFGGTLGFTKHLLDTLYWSHACHSVRDELTATTFGVTRSSLEALHRALDGLIRLL